MQKKTLLAKAKFFSLEDKEKCLAMLKAERTAFNEASKVLYNLEQNNIVDLHRAFYRKFRDSHPEFPSQIAIIGQRSCMAAYRSAKSNKHKMTSPAQKKRLSIQFDRRTSKWIDRKIRITTLGKRINVGLQLYPKLKDYFDEYQVCDPKFFVKEGEVWVSCTFKVPFKTENGSVLGIDIGIRNFATTSDGKLIRDKQFLKRKRKLRYLKRTLQGVAKKGSKSAKRHLKKLRLKESNMNKDFCHRASNEVLKTEAKIIVLEDLSKIKERKSGQRKGSKNAISQVPIHMFKETLSYKALLAGKQVKTVNPKYTSQIDHNTGRRDGCERKGRRFYGKKGRVLDADVNAAINIASKVAKKSANSSPKHPILCCKALDGQVEVVDLSTASQPTDRGALALQASSFRER